jgi:hypothetical protein
MWGGHVTDASSSAGDTSSQERARPDTAGQSTGAPAENTPRRRRPSGQAIRAGADKVRTKIASLVWLVAVICALFLAVGALVVALKMNQENPIVNFVLETAEGLDLGTFKKFEGQNAEVKGALTNWGIAAVIYLLVGKVVDRIIRP